MEAAHDESPGDMESFVHVELELEETSPQSSAAALFRGEEDDESGEDSGTEHFSMVKPGTRLQRQERHPGVTSGLPDTFQTSHLLFYERFKAYQDYMLGDCKPSEIKPFIADYLRNVVEPRDWQALWCTDVFDVLLEVTDVDFSDLKASVSLVLPLQCETRGCELDEESMKSLLEATRHRVSLLELQVVFEESGTFDMTALAVEHLRFFYKHIWRPWDEEDEDDDFDYFVRCVEPRLRLYYDILEDRVPAGLVSEYQLLLSDCTRCFQQFSVLRSGLSSDSESELDNVSMVEGLELFNQHETLKRKLYIIENPLLRYVLAYKGNSPSLCVQSRGKRESGVRMVHVVCDSCNPQQLQSLLNDRLLPDCSADDTEIQFHRDPVSAVDSCHEGDMVLVLPGVYRVTSSMFLPDSITVEGFGLPDDVVIEKKSKGDSFVESTGADVRLSNIKFIQHDAIEGILNVRQGALSLENCVLQCNTTGVVLRSSAHLSMHMCDLYGSKGAGVEIYPGSRCKLVGNGIHHCKDGILIKDFAKDVMPSIIMENNVIHNNEGYGVILVKGSSGEEQVSGGNHAEQVTDVCLSAEESSKDGVEAEPARGGTAPTPEPPPAEADEDGAPSLKVHFCRQLSKSKEATCSRPVEDLMEHEIFTAIHGNQFRRNGAGDWGTFFY
ncbi:SHC SH2 domain-binding protein 1 isoform X1 [Synchiropus splendidus]|uniref:SHC SH2 domain-binding protein 1 isoform X1 n=1 Tax=Synchiropus splendidus TaxID=270530 RepID=UPI00237D917B|nr:SHC SH2 domain-binding protein 1 isoform X1 [Synchiropus splendidus]